MKETPRKGFDLSDKKKKLLKQILQKEMAARQLQERNGDSEVRSTILPRSERESYPLSNIQRHMWLLDQLEPRQPITSVLRIDGDLDLALLRQGVKTLIERHELLRAVFLNRLNQQDRPVQHILPTVVNDLSFIDLSELEAEAAQQALSTCLSLRSQHSFDLAQGPLLRTTLIRLASEEHFCAFSLHPIVADTTSLVLLCRELLILYRNALMKQVAPFPEPVLSYADYADWQRHYLQGASLQEQQTYWKQHLAGAPLTLNLPLDHAYTAQTSNQHITLSRELPSSLTRQILAFCIQEDLPLSHLLFTVTALLLNRYTGQNDILLGLFDTYRPPEMGQLVGPFATTLPIHIHISRGLSGQQFLQYLHTTLLAARQHADLSLEQIVEAAFPEHDLTRAPLFQVSFAFHRLPSFAAFSAQLLPLVPTQSQQDLSFVFQYSDQRLWLNMVYNHNLFEAASVERLLEHYSQLLQSFVQQPARPLSTFSCLTPHEQVQLLYTWNAPTLTEAGMSRQCIHQLFQQQVQRTPQAVALSNGQQRLTYLELNSRANQLAHLLQRRDIGPEHMVGLCLTRSFDLIIGLLAILKAGAAYVPLDPGYPRDHLAFTIGDAQPTLILTQRDLVDQMPFPPELALCLDTPDLYKEESSEDLPGEIHNEHAAYVIYTSGSTGKPKGVCISHRSVVIFLYWARQQFSDEELAGVFLATSICFDLSIFELFAPLCWGGRAILATSVLDLPQHVEREQVTLLNTVPSAAAALLNSGDLPSSILTINLAGEALPRDLVQDLYRQTKVRRVCNLYGPTEDTTYSTWAVIEAEEQGAVTIGRPLPNTQVYIADDQMQLVPVGVVGELYLGGDGQARGYLNRPELTAERFVPDPFSNRTGSRLYKTGDLARYRSDGNIDYLGRRDYQVKVRGFRIELGEIETHLRQHPAVAEAIVLAEESSPGDKRLVAYVVAHPQQECDASLLRQHLHKLVPPYMVPTFFFLLKSLPQTASGKVDRKALPALRSRNEQASLLPSDIPQGTREQWLALLWQEILQVPKIGRSDNFFLCGGDSLRAMRLLNRIQRDFQVVLSLEDIFTAPTIAQMATRLLSGTIQPALEQIQPAQDRTTSPETPLPLSFAQQRIWFVDQLENGAPMYNVPLVLALTGPLNHLALYQAVREIIRRHEPLRTAIRTVKGQPFAFISDCTVPDFAFIDLSDMATTPGHPSPNNPSLHPHAHDYLLEEAQRPFDLSTDPLLRTRLLRLREDEHILMLNMHHIITDGWSLNILTEELNTLYNAFRCGRPSPLPELSIRYGDFVAWQHEHQSTHFAEDLEYWKACFSPLPPTLPLLTDYPRPSVQTFTGNSLSFQIPSALFQQALALSLQENITLFMTLLSAFLVLLARYSGQEDLVVGTSVANRPRTELEELIGFFVNTLALRADLSGNPTGRELLHRVSAVTLDAYRHQEVPFEQVVKAVQPQRDLARSPLFQVLFLLQNTPSVRLDLQDLYAQPMRVLPSTSQFDLSFMLEENAAGLCLTIEYNTQLFLLTTIERLQGHYQTLLAFFCTQPDRHVQEMPLFTEVEYSQLVYGWNQTEANFPAEHCLHKLFSLQVERTPNASAIQDGERVLSYQQLNIWTSQLAHLLQKRGVGPDVLVGLCLNRSLEQMIGLLAILKAGGTYVPLDPTLPPERLLYLLTDAHISLVLTQEAYLTLLEAPGRDLLCVPVVDGDQTPKAEDQQLPNSTVSPLNLAYVIYTSGSTGRPKGVLISHRSVVNHCMAIARHYQLTAQDRVLQFSSLSFDAAVEEIFPTWLAGATLVLRPLELPAFAQFHTWIEQEHITLLDLPTAYWHAWVQELERRPRPLPDCLRLVIIGGEKAEPERWHQWQRQVGNTVLLSNTYGPTEATVTATLYDVPEVLSAQENAGSLAIGQPLANVQGYVLDTYLQPVPVGIHGELYLSGEGVARGYLGQPALTAERFVPDPFSTLPGSRMYRTGDRVYRRADGQIVYLGREDQQVKTRGFRIELGEIETHLRQHPAVAEAIVLAEESSPGDKRLVAYVVAHPQQECDASLLRQHLHKLVPPYMVPTFLPAQISATDREWKGRSQSSPSTAKQE